MLRRNRTKVRWLFIRLFADNLKNLFRGWLFHMTTRKVDAEKDLVSWTILSESIIQVKRWEGMNEINASRFHTDMWGDQRFIHLGGDATYVHGRRDLKLQNTHKADILLKTNFDYESLTLICRLYSPVPLEGSVRIENQILQKILPPNLDEQRYYRDGCVIMTRRYFRMADGNDVVTYSKIEKYQPFRLII